MTHELPPEPEVPATRAGRRRLAAALATRNRKLGAAFGAVLTFAVIASVATQFAPDAAPAPIVVLPAGCQNPGSYQVLQNETYTIIAAKLGIVPEQLADANGTTQSAGRPSMTAVLWPGRCLEVPDAPPTTTAPATTTTTTTTAPSTTAPATTQPATTQPATTVPPTTAAPTTTVAATTTTPSPTTTTAPPAPGGFSNGFSGTDDFTTLYNHGLYRRDTGNVDPQFQTQWEGDHDMGCGNPTTHRTIHKNMPEEVFYRCGLPVADAHLMVSEGDTNGYSIAWFSPKQTFQTISKVCWEVNLTNLGTRQWWEVAVMPANLTELSAHADVANDASSPGGTQVLIYPSSAFDVAAWSGVSQWQGKLAINGVRLDTGVNQNAGNDKAARYPGCFEDLHNGTLRFTLTGPVSSSCMSAPGAPCATKTIVYDRPGSFNPGPLKVVFKNHAYTPRKDGPIAGATWHWDKIVITP